METSYMIQGLLCMRQYLDSSTPWRKNQRIDRINNLFNSVEFDWFTNGEKTLYWGWSPDFGYNLKIQGYNETLITYLIAASSPTHSITTDTYIIGYANNGGIKNGKNVLWLSFATGRRLRRPFVFYPVFFFRTRSSDISRISTLITGNRM